MLGKYTTICLNCGKTFKNKWSKDEKFCSYKCCHEHRKQTGWYIINSRKSQDIEVLENASTVGMLYQELTIIIVHKNVTDLHSEESQNQKHSKKISVTCKSRDKKGKGIITGGVV